MKYLKRIGLATDDFGCPVGWSALIGRERAECGELRDPIVSDLGINLQHNMLCFQCQPKNLFHLNKNLSEHGFQLFVIL